MLGDGDTASAHPTRRRVERPTDHGACGEPSESEPPIGAAVSQAPLDPQARPNAHLTREEKETKRRLKRHLKQKTRVRKYQVRWTQALSRGDAIVAGRASGELEEYVGVLRREPQSVWHQPDFQKEFRKQEEHIASLERASRGETDRGATGDGGTRVDLPLSTMEQARRWMNQKIWQKLILRITDTSPSPRAIAPPKSPTNGHAAHVSTTRALPKSNGASETGGENPLQPRQQQQEQEDDEKKSGDAEVQPVLSTKQQQTHEARALLSHMTKGTQRESMFDNDSAIVGYTRQKFMERALLAFKSIYRLEELVHGEAAAPGNDTSSESNERTRRMWQRLLQAKHVVSIGCGPGCDAVGVLTFLYLHRERRRRRTLDKQEEARISTNEGFVLERMLLMDYVMPQWKRLVIDELIPIISPGWVERVDTSACDVRFSLAHEERNKTAWEAITKHTIGTMGASETPAMDLIVVSYLLTETRDQWMAFFEDLLQRCVRQARSSLLLLSEPTAWQLHSFQTTFTDYLDDYLWLDSSRDSPHLQPLEGRMGPAVVLLQTKTRVS